MNSRIFSIATALVIAVAVLLVLKGYDRDKGSDSPGVRETEVASVLPSSENGSVATEEVVESDIHSDEVNSSVSVVTKKAEPLDEIEKSKGKSITMEPGVNKSGERTFASLARFGKAEIPAGIFDVLYEAEKGDTVTISEEPPLSGIVSMKEAKEGAGKVIGVSLDLFAHSSLFLAQDPEGLVTGSITQKDSPVAFEITMADKDADKVLLERKAIDDLICAKVEHGAAAVGLIPAPDNGEEEASEGEGDPQGVIPTLNSLPGAARVIYLDFDGETVTGSSWNTINGRDGSPINAAAYGNQNNIQGIWEVMAEDFAPFNVNVTTQRSVFNNASSANRCMVIFTPTTDFYPGAGGVAYLNSYGSNSNYMCWVFNAGLNGASEAGSHEAGHQLGLGHDATSSASYYGGHTHSSGVEWGPIMGASYGQHIVQWSKGEYPDANNQQDDLVRITQDLPYRTDDYGNTTGSPSIITAGSARAFTRNGIIERTSDVDMFRLTTNKAGAITLSAATISNYRDLDIRLRLLNSSGGVIQSNNPTGGPGSNPWSASINSGSNPAGTYYIEVSGVGLGTGLTGYTDYGSLGQYTLTGTYAHSDIPSPPTGLTAADNTTALGIAVTWDSLQDATGYRLYFNTSNASGSATLLTDTAGTSFTHTSGTVPETTYYYWLKAYNAVGESGFSAVETGSRALPLPDVPSGLSATDRTNSNYIRVTWSAASWASGYKLYRNTSNSTSGGQLIQTLSGGATVAYNDTSPTPETNYYYYVTSTNTSGESGFSNIDVGVRRSPLPDRPDGVTATDGTSNVYTEVTWNAVSNVTGYRIYRHTASNGAGSFLANSPTTSYQDTSGVGGTTYYYYVYAYNNDGNSPASLRDAGFREVAPPNAPGGVTVEKGLSGTSVKVSWDGTAETTQYQVFRGFTDSPNEAFYLGNTTGNLFFRDYSALDGRTYFYFVKAINSAGSSSFDTGDYGHTTAESLTDDLYENNDVMGTAYSLGFTEETWFSDSLGTAIAEDIDWYKVSLGGSNNQVDILLTFPASSGDIDLGLYDGAGTMLKQSTSTDPNEAISHLFPGNGGDYYIRVAPKSGTGGGVYDLKWKSLTSGENGNLVDAALGKNLAALRGKNSVSTFGGGGQTLSSTSKSNKAHIAYFSVENEGAVDTDVVTSGTRASRYFNVVYYRLDNGVWTNVTGEVTTSVGVGFTPLEEKSYKVFVKPRKLKKTQTKSTKIWIRSYLDTDSTVVDVSRFSVKKKGARKKKRKR